MSLKEQARQLIDQAETAIRANNPQYATELLRQSILYNGKDADAYILLGIALAQVGMPADSENALKRATHLAPESVKARYNLAVHQYSQGQVRAALNSARKATELDRSHEGSRKLAERIEQELGIGAGDQPQTTAAGNPSPAEQDPGRGADGGAPFVDRVGQAWTPIAWFIVLLSAVGLVLTLTIVSPSLGQNVEPDAFVKGFSHDPRSFIASALAFTSMFFGIVWTAMDAINRKGNLLWLLPQVFCGCTGFTFIVLPVYLLVGRKRGGNAEPQTSVN